MLPGTERPRYPGETQYLPLWHCKRTCRKKSRPSINAVDVDLYSDSPPLSISVFFSPSTPCSLSPYSVCLSWSLSSLSLAACRRGVGCGCWCRRTREVLRRRRRKRRFRLAVLAGGACFSRGCRSMPTVLRRGRRGEKSVQQSRKGYSESVQQSRSMSKCFVGVEEVRKGYSSQQKIVRRKGTTNGCSETVHHVGTTAERYCNRVEQYHSALGYRTIQRQGAAKWYGKIVSNRGYYTVYQTIG